MASSKLLKLIQNWADSYVTSSELVAEIMEQAKQEQIDKDELRELIESSLKSRGLEDRQIRNVLPSELKRTYHKSAMIAESPKSALETVEIRQRVEVQEAKSVKELESIVGAAAVKIAEQVQPKPPVDNDPTPDFPKPTEEPDDGTEYKGDAGNDPRLIAKYVKESDPLVVFLDVPKFMGHFFAANQNKIGAYLYVKDSIVYKVEAANIYKPEIKAK